MSYIQFDAVTQVFGGHVKALDHIDLNIKQGEFVCLLGPSGCGKSTLLSIAAGFNAPSSGRVLVDGKEVHAPHPDRVMVFQEYGLFPWMTVSKNISFGLENAGWPKEKIQQRVSSLLAMSRLTDFAQAYPKTLSGGMRQRVAIARAIALNPPILLMDEPFAALDALTRRNLQDELLRVWQESGCTILFVTHAIEEAMYMADRIIVMTYRPGTIKCDLPLPLPRPRDARLAAYIHLLSQIEAAAMAEQNKLLQAEIGR